MRNCRCRKCGEVGHYKRSCTAPYSLIVRTCTDCNEEQYHDQFYKYYDRLGSVCKGCMYERNRKYALKHNKDRGKIRVNYSLDYELKIFLDEYSRSIGTKSSTLLNEIIKNLKEKEGKEQ